MRSIHVLIALCLTTSTNTVLLWVLDIDVGPVKGREPHLPQPETGDGGRDLHGAHHAHVHRLLSMLLLLSKVNLLDDFNFILSCWFLVGSIVCGNAPLHKGRNVLRLWIGSRMAAAAVVPQIAEVFLPVPLLGGVLLRGLAVVLEAIHDLSVLTHWRSSSLTLFQSETGLWQVRGLRLNTKEHSEQAEPLARRVGLSRHPLEMAILGPNVYRRLIRR
mmetsp:Transcript_11565/g.32802  ORF Transcript_11565/g.32802 Transcript_11565/m.32802 type:complete len:217 (+) Transcript_11565:503-1153(+)